MKYFTIAELARSEAAAANGIDNTPPPDVKVRLTALGNNLLDPIRARWGKPIKVNSGFRCPTVNKLVKGAVNSQHTKGEAADITAGSRAQNKKLFAIILQMQREGLIQFDQLIWEKGTREGGPDWIHISYRGGNNRNQTL